MTTCRSAEETLINQLIYALYVGPTSYEARPTPVPECALA